MKRVKVRTKWKEDVLVKGERGWRDEVRHEKFVMTSHSDREREKNKNKNKMCKIK